MRWKPPPADSNIGWRVELRTMEVQLTDFENAAFTVFCVLVLRVLLSFDLNIYVPMSKVHENMDRAHSSWSGLPAKVLADCITRVEIKPSRHRADAVDGDSIATIARGARSG